MVAPMHASIAYGGPWGTDLGAQVPRAQRYQYNERFSKEVKAKAMKLLEKFMTPEQYEAFMDKADIELENKVGDHRLIINRSGVFKLLKGARGKGIVMTSGSVRSYKYPLGDEIAVFLDWFRHRTVELIERWRCGTYGIVEDGKLR